MSELRTSSLMESYRVLDLTEGGYLIAGKVLGDLGADVIKIEPPGGSPSRNIGPFYGDTPDTEKSLFWFAYNTNKRSITLDLETAEGQETFKRLVRSTDFVLESFQPGYLENLGLGYDILSEINPRIVVTSITPFGRCGPYAHFKSSDLTAWAMGGYLAITGIADRPPVSVSFPQACLHAGNNAAAASMIAHWHREMTGEGQHIDVSTQLCVLLALYGVPRGWEFYQIARRPRSGSRAYLPNGDPGPNVVHRCKDGEVLLFAQGGASSVLHNSSINLVKYMAENSMASDWLKQFDWVSGFNYATITWDTIKRIEGEIDKFLVTKTKKELYKEAIERRILLAPYNNARDVFESRQLRARDFWVHVKHPELGEEVTYCGPFIKLSEAPLTVRRRPPLVGEHNEEIHRELDASTQESSPPKQAKVTKKAVRATGKQALEGIKVADFSWSIVGPLTTKHLADHGATVVRVESHTKPGTMRVGGPFKDGIPGIDRSGLYTLYNTSKYGMSLNLDKPEGGEVARRLIMWADVVLETFTPGAMKRLGLDYETMSKAKPDIIYASSSCYGQYGPIANNPGYGQMASAQAGITNLIGWSDLPTMTKGMPHTDFISPPFMVSAIMAALDYRRRTGKGIYMEQSQVEAGVHFLAPPIMDYIVNKHIMERNGNRCPHAAPHGVYPCFGDDRWCAITVFSDKEWQGFCDAIGNPQWTEDARFTTLADRKKNEVELDRLVGEWTANFTPDEVMTRLQEKGVAAGVVKLVNELFEDPQIEHFGFWRYLEHPVVGRHAHEGPPFKLSMTPDRQFTSPCLGQHNEYIYKELLGYSDDEIADLLVEGVITTEADVPDFKASF